MIYPHHGRFLQKHDGIDPVVAKWLLKLEIVITEQGDEIRHLREEVRELRNHEPL